jgi:hypothetical protein
MKAITAVPTHLHRSSASPKGWSPPFELTDGQRKGRGENGTRVWSSHLAIESRLVDVESRLRGVKSSTHDLDRRVPLVGTPPSTTARYPPPHRHHSVAFALAPGAGWRRWLEGAGGGMMNGAHAMERCRRSSAEGGWRPSAAVWLRGGWGAGETGWWRLEGAGSGWRNERRLGSTAGGGGELREEGRRGRRQTSVRA